MEAYQEKILKDVIRQLSILSDRLENVHNGTIPEINEVQELVNEASEKLTDFIESN